MPLLRKAYYKENTFVLLIVTCYCKDQAHNISVLLIAFMNIVEIMHILKFRSFKLYENFVSPQGRNIVGT